MRGDVILKGDMLTLIEGCRHTPSPAVLLPKGTVVECAQCDAEERRELEERMVRTMQAHMKAFRWWSWQGGKAPPWPALWNGTCWVPVEIAHDEPKLEPCDGCGRECCAGSGPRQACMMRQRYTRTITDERQTWCYERERYYIRRSSWIETEYDMLMRGTWCAACCSVLSFKLLADGNIEPYRAKSREQAGRSGPALKGREAWVRVVPNGLG